ncbi:MAG: hypothetical protein PF589_12385, partial [Gammaproteobacteria bacterium]|nr:hypothetical protein [Gammaproteobacteria bacterium]
MSHKPMPQTKHILSNPLALFAAQFPDAEAVKKKRLAELCNQKEALKNQSRAIQTQTKIISRKIGEAKKNNQPATELIESMQTHSKQSRQLQAELKKVEANIQDFFSPGDDKDLAKTSSAEVDIDRRYCVTEDSPAKLSIELLVKEDNAWNEYVAGHPAA